MSREEILTSTSSQSSILINRLVTFFTHQLQSWMTSPRRSIRVVYPVYFSSSSPGFSVCFVSSVHHQPITPLSVLVDNNATIVSALKLFPSFLLLLLLVLPHRLKEMAPHEWRSRQTSTMSSCSAKAILGRSHDEVAFHINPVHAVCRVQGQSSNPLIHSHLILYAFRPINPVTTTV